MLSAGEPGGSDTVRVAALHPVDSAGGPLPRNDTERLLFRHRFETPLRLDCLGRARPGLATSWSSDSTGRSWTLVLEDGVVAAADLVSEWRARAAALSALRWAGVESMVPLDRQRLVITLHDSSATVPPVFADPSLALRAPPGGRVVLDVISGQGEDPRDALDRGSDLLQTDDPAVIDYAASRPDLRTVALPWSRTYLLLIPAGGAIGLSIGADSAAFRESLARDAVRGAARAAAPPFWWEDVLACGKAPGSAAAGRPRPEGAIAYPRGDRIARELTQRIVALAGGGTAAAGLGEDELAAALRIGSEPAYVISVPRRVLLPCRELAGWPAGATAIPLVDTRSSLIVRRGTPVLTAEWDGTVRLEKRR